MKRLLNLCPPYCHAVLLAGGLIFSAAAYSQSGQKYAVGGNNLDENDQLGSKNNAPLRFVTNNNERARFTPSGNFGVGTTTPNASLTVNGSFQLTDGTQQNGYVLTSDGSGMATWQSLSSNNTGLWQKSGSDIFYNAGNVSAGNNLSVGNRLEVGSFFKAGNDTVKITSNYSAINSTMFCIGGLMGVGGAVPTVALDVQGDFKLTGNSEVGGILKLPAIADTTFRLIGVDVNGDVQSSEIIIPINCVNPVIAFEELIIDNAPDAVKLCPKYERLGIGVNPSEELHVNGTIRTDGTRTIVNGFNGGDNHWISTDANEPDGLFMAFINDPQTNHASGVQITPGGNQNGAPGLYVNDDLQVSVGSFFPPANIAFNVKGTSRLNGDTRVNGQLDVCGTIRSTEWIVETGWCDFVFDKDYKRPSLLEKSAFYEKHGHLMYIEPGEKIENEGLPVAKTMKGMVRNLEELSLDQVDLYKLVLEQREMLDKQSEKIKVLEQQVSSLQKQ